nr:PREDICTED: trihelix transcription factor PTL-like [Bemisia tabaci]
MLKVQTTIGVEIQWKIVEHELFTKLKNSPELQKQYAIQLVCENVKSGALKPCTLVGWELAESLEGSSQQVEEGVRQPTGSPDSASTGMEVGEFSGELSTPVLTDVTGNENIPDNNVLWSWAPTKLLINIRLSMDPDFVRPKCSKKALWNRVSAKMKEKGYTFTDKDCKEKFKNLYATYRRNAAKAGPNGTGEEAIKWPHYQEFKEVFHKKAKINIPPQLLGSSMNPDSISTDICSEKVSEDCSDVDDPEPNASTSKQKGKKKRVIMTSKVYYSEKLALEKRKLEAKKERDEAREQMKKEYREKKLELLEKLVRNKTGDSS